MGVRYFENGRTMAKQAPPLVEKQPEPAAPKLEDIVLKAFLEERKLPYSFVKWDKADPEYPALRKQLVAVMQRDQFTYPQIFEHGKFVDREEFYERERQKAALGTVDDDMDF